MLDTIITNISESKFRIMNCNIFSNLQSRKRFFFLFKHSCFFKQGIFDKVSLILHPVVIILCFITWRPFRQTLLWHSKLKRFVEHVCAQWIVQQNDDTICTHYAKLGSRLHFIIVTGGWYYGFVRKQSFNRISLLSLSTHFSKERYLLLLLFFLWTGSKFLLLITFQSIVSM